MEAVLELPSPELQEEIQRWGEQLWDDVKGEVPGLFNTRHLYARLMDWAIQDRRLKVALFRLVDVLPSLETPAQVAGHAREYLRGEARILPWFLRDALQLTALPPIQHVLSAIFKFQVRTLGRRFIVGDDVRHALPALRRLRQLGIGFTADLLGEATLSASEATAYERHYLEMIDILFREAAQWPENPVLDFDHLGPIPRANISVKVSALDPSLDPVDPAGGVARLRERLLRLFLRCKERNVFVNLDMEQWALHDITYTAFEEVVQDPELRSWPHVGIVVQAYLKEAQADVERLVALEQRRGAPITVRLVKGAYWDSEVVHARQHGFPCPVFTEKAATDANYERLTVQLLDHIEALHPAFGSHNLRSLSHAIVQAERRGIPRSAYEIQMLYGMAEPEQRALGLRGHRVRLYAPIGDLVPGMAYLVRRLLENTANQGFLRLAYQEKTDMHTLLRPPKRNGPTRARTDSARLRAQRPRAPRRSLQAPFENCPHTDFTDPRARSRFAKAIEDVGASLPREIPVVVNGQPRQGGATLERLCPSDLRLRVAQVSRATPEDCDGAVAAALGAWPSWRDRPVQERAALLDALADRLEADRAELAAVEVLEVAKPWAEADADVAEAIDYCRYYARQALVELTPQQLRGEPGEINQLWYEGRGPTAVIAPWNFPAAILCGMASAALVAGNPVLLKPAEQSSATGYALYEQMRAAGFPDDVVHSLPGTGEEVGARLVEHPGIAMIAFTGSMQVGLSILEKAGRTQPGQPQIKRVVCEMGGKNAVIIDEDADLDEAISGVMTSAFGYAGQKCSACSRAIVVAGAYEPFLGRLSEACRSLIVAPAQDPGCELGPVIDQEAHDRLRSLLSSPGVGAVPVYVGPTRQGGYYVPPAVFTVQDPAHPLMQTELFGPILAVMKVGSFERALEVALATPFALTGAVYSRSPNHMEMAARGFRVGNLYLNRGCTGAYVGRQPFGGFGMSGGGTKAGGRGYLLNYAVPRCVTDNTVRRGFTPELTE